VPEPAAPADPRVIELEEAAFRAWPASRVEALGGWRLRACPLPTRRINSVWTCASEGGLGLRARIAAAEAFYAGLGQQARFQLSPASQPPDLDARLAARGYVVEAPVRVQAASVADVAGHARAAGVTACVLERPEAEWLELAGRRGRFRDRLDAFVDLLARVGAGGGFALARVDGEPAATALGVCEAPWCGIFAMATLAEQRRRGAARALLAALAAWGAARGARQLYLQVETDNAAALALYAAAGFRDVYAYHYRTLQTGT
jgi:ribosomal protein S18 acetylase RimI-like enzyme